MGRLQGKIAIVTGGSSGIGQATVMRFVEEGATVLFTDVNEARGREIEQSTGTLFVMQDVASEDSWRDIAQLVTDRFGRLDVLVNNAGMMSGQTIDASELETWNRVINVNLTGLMLGCRAAIEIMKRNANPAGGSIINLGSTTSFMGLPTDAAYTTSKAGVIGLTRSVSTYCALQHLSIRCNSVHPGPTLTGIIESAIAAQPALREGISNMAPMGRIGTPTEIANMVVYLASDESSYSTGAQFVVDGGVTSAHPRGG